jgi:ATP-binding cassette subfamily C (CFTR/MRP) protein 1
LSFADHFILLGDGGVVIRQGSVNSLSADDGDLLQKFASQPPPTISRTEPDVPDSDLVELEMLKDPEPGAGRQTGDMTIYWYYAKVAGWTIMAYLLGCMAFVFGVNFPCKLPRIPQCRE